MPYPYPAQSLTELAHKQSQHASVSHPGQAMGDHDNKADARSDIFGNGSRDHPQNK